MECDFKRILKEILNVLKMIFQRIGKRDSEFVTFVVVLRHIWHSGCGIFKMVFKMVFGTMVVALLR